MPGIKTMPASRIWELLEGQEDILTPAKAEEQASLSKLTCPACSASSIESRTNPENPFSDGKILSNKVAVCQSCHVEFDPYSFTVLRSPTLVSD